MTPLTSLFLNASQAGLVGILVKRFRTAIAVTLAYISLSIGFHVWSLNVRWDNPASYWWTDGLLALFVVQRFCKKSSGGCSIDIGLLERTLIVLPGRIIHIFGTA